MYWLDVLRLLIPRCSRPGPWTPGCCSGGCLILRVDWMGAPAMEPEALTSFRSYPSGEISGSRKRDGAHHGPLPGRKDFRGGHGTDSLSPGRGTRSCQRRGDGGQRPNPGA